MYLPNFFLIIFNICYKSLTINKLQQVFLGMFVYIYNVSDRGYQGKGLPCILCLVYA